MENQKIENLLNLALASTEEELSAAPELNAGFNESNQTWEVIVRYLGDLPLKLKDYPEVKATYLLNQYAILYIPKNRVEAIAGLWEVAYMEKPKQLFFETAYGMSVSCMTALRKESLQLYGNGTIIGVVDSGIDFSHPLFQNQDKTSKILLYWDQVQNQIYTREDINAAINGETPNSSIWKSTDVTGHGTHVAGIASSVAPQADLIIVKLGNVTENSFPMTADLMRGVNFCLEQSIVVHKPVAVNLSCGNNYGSHSGSSLIELYLNSVATIGRNSIVVGSGNEGYAAGHTAGQLKVGTTSTVELAVGYYETGLSVQIWKTYGDEFNIEIISPSEKCKIHIEEITGAIRYPCSGTELLVYYGMPNPYATYQEIYIQFLPTGDYIEPGNWKILMTPTKLIFGQYDMWIPVHGSLNTGTAFLYPEEDTTMTIPSTARQVITVGAYDAYYDRMASFSGRGYTRITNQVKPDLVAPGVDISSASPGGGYVKRSGTSMATPFVSGAAALLMEWGIVRGNDPFLYGEKLKSYLIKGARRLPGFSEWPNPQAGWGALCVKDSLPL